MTRKTRKSETKPTKTGAVELEAKDLDEVQGGTSFGILLDGSVRSARRQTDND